MKLPFVGGLYKSAGVSGPGYLYPVLSCILEVREASFSLDGSLSIGGKVT